MNSTDFAALRDRAKLTQREVAILLGVTERTVWRWETGEGKIPALKWQAIQDRIRQASKARGNR